MIVDSHIHVVSRDRTAYPVRQDRPLPAWVDRIEATDDAILEATAAAGVDAVVAVQPDSVYGSDNRYAVDSARRNPSRIASVGIIDHRKADVASTLAAWIRVDGMSGIRLVALEDHTAFATPADPVWALASTWGVPVCVLTTARHLTRLERVLVRHPSAVVLLDHLAMHSLAMETQGRQDVEAYIATLAAMAKHTRLMVKLSTDNLVTAKTSGVGTKGLLAPLLESFGPERVVWGSDYPMTSHIPYPDQVRLAKDELSFLTDANMTRVLGGNALAIWQLRRPDLRPG